MLPPSNGSRGCRIIIIYDSNYNAVSSTWIFHSYFPVEPPQMMNNDDSCTGKTEERHLRPNQAARCIYYDYDDELRASVLREYGPTATLSPYAANASLRRLYELLALIPVQSSWQCDYVQTRAHFRADTDTDGAVRGDGNIFVWPRNVVRIMVHPKSHSSSHPPQQQQRQILSTPNCRVASSRCRLSFVNVMSQVSTPNTVTDPGAWAWVVRWQPPMNLISIILARPVKAAPVNARIIRMCN